ncbi:MAG: hypothetical protein IJ187_03890 [Neisseriaceae bacterium]|nr:hypothetical protein [Neisseriaceae bacterium]
MLNNKSKQSAFFTLCISAVLALSLTSCKKNTEKQDTVSQKNTTIQQNEVNQNNQAVIQEEQPQKINNEQPVLQNKPNFNQNDAKHIVLMLDYCINNQSPEICEKIADIYNGGIIDGKIKIANNAKAQIKQQLNIDLDNEFKVYEEQIEKMKNLETKIQEIRNNQRKLQDNNTLTWEEKNKADNYLNKEDRTLSSEMRNIREKYMQSYYYNSHFIDKEKDNFDEKIKETIYKLYHIACYNKHVRFQSNYAPKNAINHGSTTACNKAALVIEDINNKKLNEHDELGRYKEYASDIYASICKEKRISDFCVMAGDSFLHISPAQMRKDNEYVIVIAKTKEEQKEMKKIGKIIKDINANMAAYYYSLAEKTPEVEEKLALAQTIDKYIINNIKINCGSISSNGKGLQRRRLTLLVKDITDQRTKINRLWEIAKSDACILQKDGQLFLEDRAKMLEKQQQENNEFLQSIGVPTN